MSSRERRAADRRRAWGRGPVILRFEPLEGRQLLSATPTHGLSDLVGESLTLARNVDWGGTFEVDGAILNQGRGTANVPFNVEFFASATPNITATSYALGEITIPAGLGPNKDAPFQADLTLPPTAIPGYSDGRPLYIAIKTDPEGAVTENNKNNNSGVGLGHDVAVMTISPPRPSNLIGTTLAINPQQSYWGQAVSVTAQVANNAQGDAPPTLAKLVLTPSGAKPGGSADVTVGYLAIPAVAAWQTVNIARTITLPAAPVAALAGSTNFTLSMVQDSGYAANILYQHVATQVAGLDQVQIAIGPNPDISVPAAAAVDLAADGVQGPTQPIYWGQTFQVTAGVDNLGPGNAGAFNVKFLLTGNNGSLTNAIFLGDATVPGLSKGTHQDITETLKLPNRLPNGVNLSSIVVGRIAVVVDADSTINDTLKTNDTSFSNPVTLRVLGSDGTSTVPTLPAVTTTPAPAPSLGAATPAGTLQAHVAAGGTTHKLHRRAKPKHQSLTAKIEHRLKVFPHQVDHFYSNLVKGKNS